jgi:hypothetical protein
VTGLRLDEPTDLSDGAEVEVVVIVGDGFSHEGLLHRLAFFEGGGFFDRGVFLLGEVFAVLVA